jgi:hypothetical protein
VQGFKPMVQNTAPYNQNAYHRYRVCQRKTQYRNMAAANAAVQDIKDNGMDARPGMELRSYFCEYCSTYHVGHACKP